MNEFLKFIFEIKLYMFRAVPLSIIRSFHCTHGNGVCHTGLLTACEQDQDGISVLIPLASCMTYTIAVFTVRNS